LPIIYDGIPLDDAFATGWFSLIIKLFVNLKPSMKLLPVHQAQLITYLKLVHKRLGFLINFNVL